MAKYKHLSSVEDRSPESATSTDNVTPSNIEPVVTVAKSSVIVSVADEPNSTSAMCAGVDEPEDANKPDTTSDEVHTCELTSESENVTSWKSCETPNDTDTSSDDRPPNVAVADPDNVNDVKEPGSVADTDADNELMTNHWAPKGAFQEDSERPPDSEMGGNEPEDDDDTSADSVILRGDADDLAKAIERSAASEMAGVDEPMLVQAKSSDAEVTVTDDDNTYEPEAAIVKEGDVVAPNNGAKTVTVTVVD